MHPPHPHPAHYHPIQRYRDEKALLIKKEEKVPPGEDGSSTIASNVPNFGMADLLADWASGRGGALERLASGSCLVGRN